MKILSFNLIRKWRENYVIKYSKNRNNYSFHHSIATYVLIKFVKFVKIC